MRLCANMCLQISHSVVNNVCRACASCQQVWLCSVPSWSASIIICLKGFQIVCAVTQGISLPFDPLPHELTTGCWLALAPNGTCLLLGTLDKHSAFWSLSFPASESEAKELHHLLSTSKEAHGSQAKVGRSFQLAMRSCR